MPKMTVKPSGEWEIGVSFRELAELIGLLAESPNHYLNYNTAEIRGYYPRQNLRWLILDQHDRRVFAPYTIEYDYREHSRVEGWGIVKITPAYQFPHELAAHKAAMVDEFGRAGKLYKGDRLCPRISDFQVSDSGKPEFTIQEARYFDQVGSNLTVDYPFTRPVMSGMTSCNTVREWDMAQAGVSKEPPAFRQSRLASTIGIAVGVVARAKSGEICPFRRKRRKAVAVYEGQWHVPFSFALAWPPGTVPDASVSLSELIMQDWGHELAEELHLEVSDFKPPYPIAFCRDLVRAGKPQFFFQIESLIAAEELRKLVRSDKAEYVGGLKKANVVKESYSPELLAFSILAGQESE